MYFGYRLNIAATCIFLCSFTFAAKAQLASDKSLIVIFNKRINEKLAEKNKSNKPFEYFQQQSLTSTKSSLKNFPKLKIKNPDIVAHKNTTQSNEELKNKLPSNSSKLKQMGKPATKSPTLPLY